MKKRFEKILSDLVADYENTRKNFDILEDITSQEVAIQAMANTLVLAQTSLHNLKLWQEYLNLAEEHKEKKVNVQIMKNDISLKK